MPARKSPSKKTRTRKKTASRRELIEPRKGDKRFVRRGKAGQFKKVVAMGRSLSADKKRKAKTKVTKGQGDRGDTPSKSRRRVKMPALPLTLPAR